VVEQVQPLLRVHVQAFPHYLLLDQVVEGARTAGPGGPAPARWLRAAGQPVLRASGSTRQASSRRTCSGLSAMEARAASPT